MSKSDSPSVQERAEAVMSEIDRAFSDILDATERSYQAIDQLGDTTHDADNTADMISKIQDANARIVSICSSQDVIRQHLDFLVKDLGSHEPKAKGSSEDEKLLAGPQLDGQGLSQRDIDDMFD